jgi:hypothetical protein
VQFSDEKIAKRRASIGDVEIVFMDQPMSQSPCCGGLPNLQLGCGSCAPMQQQTAPDPALRPRRKSAPAIFSFNPALPFLEFPDADKMNATPDLINRHVMAMVDRNALANVLQQNQPDVYED